VNRWPWYRDFLTDLKRSGLVAHTLENYRHGCQVFDTFLEQRGIERIQEVDRETLAQYLTYLRDLRSRRSRPYALGTIRFFVTWAKRFFTHLQEHGRMLTDPTVGLALRPMGRQLPRAVLSAAEMEKLLAAPDVKTLWGLRDRAMLEVLYGTGLRFAELVHLGTTDVDLEEKVLWVRRGKGGRDRVLPLGRWALYWLKKYVEASEDLRRRQGTERVFLSARGQCLGDWGLEERLRAYARQAGIGKPVTLHAIRHTYATVLLKGGADVREIQKLLGHSSLSSTQIYTHLDLEDLRQVQRRCHPREKRHRQRD